jgi:hypothetical protein
MPPLGWQIAAEIATTVSTIAFAASAIVVVMQLRQAARERYFSVTAHLFDLAESRVSARSAFPSAQALVRDLRRVVIQLSGLEGTKSSFKIPS